MKIGIIGAGESGSAAGKLLARAGHDVMWSWSNDEREFETFGASVRGARHGSPAEAAAFGEVIVYSVRFEHVEPALEAAGDQIFIDTMTAYAPDRHGRIFDLAASTPSERASELAPEPRRVTTFNPSTAVYRVEGAERTPDDRVVMFLAGDDTLVKGLAADLIDDMEFAPYDLGGVAESRTCRKPRTETTEPARVSLSRKPWRRATFLASSAAFVSGVACTRTGVTPFTPRFLTTREYETLVVAVDRIFPADSALPSASELGVVDYIDRRLGGAWGAGARLYRAGPFSLPPHSGHGAQSPFLPREEYRRALAALDALAQARYQSRFAALEPSLVDAVLQHLSSGRAEPLDGVVAHDFFAQLVQNVREGLFSDPSYGGNRDARAWAWIGFPGNPMGFGLPYALHIDRYDETYVVKPHTLASSSMSM